MLEQEGLVIMIPRNGAQVAEISEKDLKDVLEVRLGLEELAVRIACQRITEEELEEKGVSCDLEEIKKDIKERDERDCTRKIAPLRQAEDAVLIDSSDMTIEEVVKAITDNIV